MNDKQHIINIIFALVFGIALIFQQYQISRLTNDLDFVADGLTVVVKSMTSVVKSMTSVIKNDGR